MKTITTLLLILAVSCQKSNESKAICWDCITKVESTTGNPGWHEYACGKTETQIREFEKQRDAETIPGLPNKRKTTCYPKPQ